LLFLALVDYHPQDFCAREKHEFHKKEMKKDFLYKKSVV